jgi:twinkle protein
MSLDFARAGAATLWGSFEIRNARLLEKMLQQYAGANLKALSPERLEQVADDFENLPLRFMNFHAGSDLGQVLDAMDFAVYRDDVQHIIIDNLQFMMPRYNVPGLNIAPVGPGGGSSSGSGGGGGMRSNFDKFNTQDAVIDELRRFATEKEVNIILVIHPRKEDDNQPLGISSIFGTAKATQEADVVLILQRATEGAFTPGGGGGGGSFRYGAAGAGNAMSAAKPSSMALAIKKNRYNGTMGKVDLGFNTAINCFYELEDAAAAEADGATDAAAAAAAAAK